MAKHHKGGRSKLTSWIQVMLNSKPERIGVHLGELTDEGQKLLRDYEQETEKKRPVMEEKRQRWLENL